jgi:hypothetical protein
MLGFLPYWSAGSERAGEGEKEAAMKPIIVTIVGLLFLVGMTIPVGQADPGVPGIAPQFLGGTVQAVDPAGLNIILQTDEGITEVLPVADADAVKGVVKGDRVSVELDEKGAVKKISKMTPGSKDSPLPKG